MKIRVKLFILLILLALFIVGGLTFYIRFEDSIFSSMLRNEKQEKIGLFDKIADLKGQSLETFAKDYTFWDEMVDFVSTGDPTWAKENLEVSLSTYKIDSIWIYRPDFSLIYSVNDLEEATLKELPVSKKAFAQLFADNKRFCHFYLNTPKGVMEIRGASIHSSTDTERKNSPQGYLFAGFIWGKEFIGELSRLTGTKIDIALLPEKNESKEIDKPEQGLVFFYKTLSSWENLPLAHLHIRAQSPTIRTFMRLSKNLFYLLLLSTVIIIGSILFFTSRWVYVPLVSISNTLKNNDPKYLSRLNKKKDEFGDISVLISKFFEQKEALIREIAERKAAEARSSRLAAIVESSDDAIIGKDLNGIIISWNKGAQKLYGYNENEIVGKTIFTLAPTDLREETTRILERIRKGEHIEHYETLRVKKDGSHIDVSLSISPILDAENRIIGASAIGRDITELKKAQRALQEAIEVRSQFISMASHELRTPLTALKESIEIVSEEAKGLLNAEQKDFLDIARRNLERLMRLINDLLDFQKLEAGRVEFHMEEHNINDLLRDVKATMSSLAVKKGLEFRLELTENLPVIKFDKDKIMQVLTNLVNNAIKFTDKGSITVASEKRDNVIVVSVQDTGPGIRKEDLPKLFLKFQQLGTIHERKTGGTGLGLAISKEIIEQHKGKIWAESEIGKSTTFSFLLPINERRVEART